MNRFFDEQAKKQIMAELLQSYLQPTIEGCLYPATRKIYSSEGRFVFSSEENQSGSLVFIRDGLVHALTSKVESDRGCLKIWPSVWEKIHASLSTWQFVGFESEKRIEDIILIFLIRDFTLEKQVLEEQLQRLRESEHYKISRCRLLLLNYSNQSNDFIQRHFHLQNYPQISIPEMESLRRLDRTLVAEMNSHFFISESYFLHLGLSRGGIFWGPQAIKNAGTRIVPLSLHHGLEIKEGSS